ncbi:hypothetical protein RI367_007845 [Sorochytrium milnesiophthora]
MDAYLLDTVRFLHENRSEGCTEDAMRGALDIGATDVVEFLVNYGYPICPPSDFAIASGFIVFLFLLFGICALLVGNIIVPAGARKKIE